jgi:ferredoxin-NADP reductase
MGAEVRIKGPMGSFTLHKTVSRPAVFLAGGIGITPFLSMLSDAAVSEPQIPISLFYANRFLEDAPYMNTLWELESSIEHFRFFPTFTRRDGADQRWIGETGHISREMLSKHVSDLHGSICYIAGAPSMVSSLRLMLIEAGVDDNDIRTEEFAGY